MNKQEWKNREKKMSINLMTIFFLMSAISIAFSGMFIVLIYAFQVLLGGEL